MSKHIKKIFISFILVMIVLIIVKITLKEKNEINNTVNNNQERPKTVEDIKNETGATADEEIYEIQQEYDGREILTIKPDVQYKTVLTGILKNGQPSMQEIEQLDLTQFHSGVWISEVSRNKFLQILNKCGIKNFGIDYDGYLYKKEDSSSEYSKKLDNLINSDELTVIDITGTCYIRDEMTGEVVEYPFKDMDLYQINERFDTEGSSIIIITTNDVEEIDILESILN